ncbi:MAG TPA: serine/threonine-protein kinase, partial [Planctomycetota bacterium]|nr:serine/threonine-protein kinase [Planctomycetota bacterium]
MTPGRFDRISRIFEMARGLSATQRETLLREECHGDPAILAEVEALLRAHDDVAASESDPLLHTGDELRGAILAPGAAEIPREVGRFRVLSEVARGGIGVVLRAHDEEIGRDVAIKLLKPDFAADARVARRLLGEGRIAGQLQHPYIVPVHEVGLLGGTTPYLTMKLVEGSTLASLLAGRANPLVERLRFLRILEQVCEAMAYAHSRRVIHRDLKPSNVMIGAFGEVQVMDWGLAKALPSLGAAPASTEDPREETSSMPPSLTAVDSNLSIAGSIMGTPAYMSPEQARGELESLDERTDVFSLGAILCEVLTGEPPFSGITTGEVLRKARDGNLGEAFARLDACTADRDLLDLARAALAPARDDRPRDAASVAAALGRHAHSLEERAQKATLAAAEERVRTRGERKARRLTVVIALLVLAGLAVGGGIYLAAERGRLEQARSAEKRLDAAVEEARSQLRSAEDRSAAPQSSPSSWEAARVAARNARSLIREDMDPALRQSAEVLVGEIENRADIAAFREELERTRTEGESLFLNRDDPRRAQLYADVFRRRFGVDFESIEAEAAAEKLMATGQAESIVPALDEWARVLRDLPRARGKSWMKIVEIARLADADPFRRSLRDALLAEDAGRLESLVRGLDPRTLEPQSLLLIALSLRQLRNDKASRAILGDAQRVYPGDFWINWFLAVAHVKPPENNSTRAAQFLTAALALRPGSPLVYQALARSYREAGLLQDAVLIARRGLEIAPDHPQSLITLGVALEALGDIEGARSAYERAESESVDDNHVRSLATHNLGVLLSREGRSAEAIRSFERSIEIAPLNFLHYNALGYEHFSHGRLKSALDAFKKAVEGNESDTRFWTNYGNALLTAGDVPAAQKAFDEAVRLDPRNALALRLLGAAQMRVEGEGRSLEKALGSFLQAANLEPDRGYPFEKAIEILEGTGDRLAKEPLRAWIEGNEKILRRSTSSTHARASQSLATAWTLLPDPSYATSALLAAEQNARRTRRQDPGSLVLLAEVLWHAGRKLTSLETVEEALALPAGDTERALSLAQRIRSEALPDLWTFGSVDAAVSGIDRDAGLEASHERFAYFLARDAVGGARLRRLYLEARLLQLEGSHQKALGKLEEVLEFERKQPGPFLALRESLDALHPPAAAEAAFRDALRKGAPESPLPRPPTTPRVLEPRGGEEADPLGFDLRATPFRHVDPRVRLEGARWRIWTEGADPERQPTLDVFIEKDEGSVRIPAGLILSGQDYRAGVLHRGSDGRWSPESDPVSFQMRAAPLERRPFDIRDQLTLDVIHDPGDETDDGLDSQGNLFGVDGFDGISTENPAAQGLPRDGRVGVHKLAEHGGP